MTTRGLVIGCGGTLGFAWTAVALAAVEEALGWDARDADVLVGSSAGAEMVAMLGSGRSTTQVLAALRGEPGADPVLAHHVAQHPGKVPPLPAPGLPGIGVTVDAVLHRRAAYTALGGLLPRGRGDATWLRELGDALAGPSGWVEHPATWLVGVDSRSGDRVAFGSADAPEASLGQAVAASWAIPGWFPPVEIGDRKYFDGGTASSTSADLVAGLGLDEVVIVAPMTSRGGQPGRGAERVERLLRSQMTGPVDREHALLEKAGVRVIRVEPGRDELAAMGANFMDLARRPTTLEAARRGAPTRVAEAIDAAQKGAHA